MKWPLNKEFAFTVIDDTDYSTVQNIKPLYEYLKAKNIITAKTIWIYPPSDYFKGQTVQDKEYYDFLLEIERDGYEILLHSVGSGIFKRPAIIEGFEIFKEKFGRYPSVNINHSLNPDNMYWGYKRFGPVLSFISKYIEGKSRKFYGDEIESDFYWGDISKKYIKYNRNRVFNGINTLKYDPEMPFREINKKDCNYWFSSSDGQTIEEFNNLITRKNVDKLIKEKGLSIIYTHFACGFVEENGEINRIFKENIDYLSSQNGWFVPISEILDYLLNIKKKTSVSSLYINLLDLKWLIDRVKKRIKYGR
jgi:hypothetical protein